MASEMFVSIWWCHLYYVALCKPDLGQSEACCLVALLMGEMLRSLGSPPDPSPTGSIFDPRCNLRSGQANNIHGNHLTMVYYDMATRAQLLTLKLIVQLDNHQIEAITGIKARTVHGIVDRALKRGLDPQASPLIILDEHVCDAPKSGRRKKQDHTDAALDKVCSRRYGREMTCAYVSAELGNTTSPS